MITLPASDPHAQEGSEATARSRAGRLPARLWRDPIHIIAFGFGAGAVPYAPGTVGTLVAIPIYGLMTTLTPMWYAVTVFLFFTAGIWICEHAQRALQVYDHPAIVWDEIVGYLITMFLITMFLAPSGWVWAILGFVLFRFFDIFKPFPIGALERRIRGGLGTMLDDALAGIYASLALYAIAYLAKAI
ncbi:MAG: phosphatidylglycerophosphatase A [Acidiferrobacterales bacterium]